MSQTITCLLDFTVHTSVVPSCLIPHPLGTCECLYLLVLRMYIDTQYMHTHIFVHTLPDLYISRIFWERKFSGCNMHTRSPIEKGLASNSVYWTLLILYSCQAIQVCHRWRNEEVYITVKLSDFKRKTWTWTPRSLAWFSINELSWFNCQLMLKY